MRKVNILIVIVLALSLIMAMVGCGEATPTPATTPTDAPVEPVRIGLVDDGSGAVGIYGAAHRAGVKTAVQLINDAGGIKSLGGAKIQLAEGVGDSTVATSISEVERLINSQGVVAIVGPTASHEILGCIPLFERYKIPGVTTLLDESQFQKGYRYLFTVNTTNQISGSIHANFIDWMAKNYGMPTDSIAVCSLTPSYITRTEHMINRLADLGYTNIVLQEEFALGVTDQTPLVMKLKAANPSLVIYLGAGQDSIAFHKACYTYDYYPWVVTEYEAYAANVVIEGLPIDVAKRVLARPNIFAGGTGATSVALGDVPSVKAFREAVEKSYPNEVKSLPQTVAIGAQRLFLLARAIDDAASRNPEDIANALRKLDIQAPDPYLVYPESTYPSLQMSDSGMPTSGLIVYEQWSDDLSELLFIWPEEYATAEPRVQK